MTLADGAQDWTAAGLGVSGGRTVVSGGQSLRLLSSSGRPARAFGESGSVDLFRSEDDEYIFGDFVVDPVGRLLVIGTARSPRNESEVPRGPNGAPLPIFPSAVRIERLLPDGRLDSSFGDGGTIETDLRLPPPRDERGMPLQLEASLTATGIAIDRQGRIVVTGGVDLGVSPSCSRGLFQPVPDSTAFIARLTASGALDPGFGGGDGVVGGRSLDETPLRAGAVGEPVISRDGTITYRSTALNGCGKHGRWGIAQLTPKGRTRKGLGRNGAVGGYFRGLAVEPDGSVVAVARKSWTEGEAFKARAIRITSGGKIDRSFGHDGEAVVKLGTTYGNEPDSLAIDSRGRILLGGTLVTEERKGAPSGVSTETSILLVRLSADGSQEMNFGRGGQVATPFPGLEEFGPSDLFLDSVGRPVTVHRYETQRASGLVLSRYLLR